jgi:hypothetical protein
MFFDRFVFFELSIKFTELVEVKTIVGRNSAHFDTSTGSVTAGSMSYVGLKHIDQLTFNPNNAIA